MTRFTSVVRDRRGAIFVMSLPMAFFLIGVLYYAIGIGDAIIRRETLQDAADASALSAAVMAARGMNLIVLINIVMASLLAILVMLRLTSTMILVGIGLCALLAWPTAGATTAAIPGLQAAYQGTENAFNTARATVNPALLALHTAASVMRYAMPLAAEARVIETSRQYAPPAMVGFAIPGHLALPTEDGTEAQLCGKAGAYAARFATLPIRWVLPEPVLDVLADGLESATQPLAAYFCSSTPGPVPPIPLPQNRVRQQFPKLPKTRECEDQVATAVSVDPAHQRVCNEARAELIASEPDPRTGDCAQTDCSAYRARVELARSECVPTERARLEEWVWQERDVTLWARLHDTHPYPIVEQQEPEYGAPRLVSGARPPCGNNGVLSREWSTDMTQPLCEQPHEALAPDGPLTNPDAPLEVTYRQVTQVISCSKQVPMVSPVSSRSSAASLAPLVQTATACGRSSRVHQNVLSGVALGDEVFQWRAIVIGDAPSQRTRNLLDAIVLRERNQTLPWQGLQLGGAVQQLSRIFVAQSEVYFDADATTGAGVERLEWMWSMDWRARLVRFRLPENVGATTPARSTGANAGNSAGSQRCGVSLPAIDLRAACELAQGGEHCAQAEDSAFELSDLVLH